MKTLPAHFFLMSISFLGLISSFGCGTEKSADSGKKDAKVQQLPPTTPGLDLQKEDYAEARRKFRTNLIKKGPAPQNWHPVKLLPGVSEVEFPSGALRLKAWTNRPSKAAAGKLPAVLFLHGGWAFGVDDWEQAQPLCEAGFIVLIPILRGENGQAGNFTMFYDEIDDVLAAADYLARLPSVDANRIYLAGHSAGGTLTMLAAMSSKRFRAAASLSGSADRVAFVNGGWDKVVPFDRSDIREFQVRSPVAYATSFKCPTRLYYGSQETVFDAETRRTAQLAKSAGLDVEAVAIPGDHFSSVPEALRQAIEFFRKN